MPSVIGGPGWDFIHRSRNHEVVYHDRRITSADQIGLMFRDWIVVYDRY
jgi:hypothetical protein